MLAAMAMVTSAFSCAGPEVIAVVSEERPKLIGKFKEAVFSV